jgi:hypothetical protein
MYIYIYIYIEREREREGKEYYSAIKRELCYVIAGKQMELLIMLNETS